MHHREPCRGPCIHHTLDPERAVPNLWHHYQRSTHRESACLPHPVRPSTQTSTELVRAQDIAPTHSSRHSLLCVLTVSECTNLPSVALWGCNEFCLDLVRTAYHDIRQSSAAGYAAFSRYRTYPFFSAQPAVCVTIVRVHEAALW